MEECNALPMSPRYNMMNSIDVNPFVKCGAYVVATSYKFGDYTPYIYKTTDYGKTWKVITSGIPREEFVRVVRADSKRQGLLYAGYKTFPGMVYYGSPNLGPKAVPGKYKVRLTTQGQSQEQEFNIVNDPM